ncbi:MAG: helix-turn-helix domain-containing protein [Candidatus Altiarchaeales archaeon]|nr:helix-turn-helix domain-containing protein [Candidatus Altiarchaeales archaeon]
MDLGNPLAKSIAGEIAISSHPSVIMKKWREIFRLSQSELANAMDVSPSVISDYESGRRKSPGTHFIKKMVESLIEVDEKHGGEIARRFTLDTQSEAILNLREFTNPITASRLLTEIDGQIVNGRKARDITVKGYTVIDSIKAIVELSEEKLKELYGSTTERALIFTKVHTGRSPLIAIKVTKPKPNLVVLHGLKPNKVDKLAVRIADSEQIPLAVSAIKSEEKLIECLSRIR